MRRIDETSMDMYKENKIYILINNSTTLHEYGGCSSATKVQKGRKKKSHANVKRINAMMRQESVEKKELD